MDDKEESAMDPEAFKPILEELFSSLEPLDAQNSAMLALLKAKGLATQEEFAPFLQEASNAASVRWLAVRVRTAALIANLMRPEQTAAEEKTEESQPEDHPPAQEEARDEPKPHPSGETLEASGDASAGNEEKPKVEDDERAA
jgi:hypothetical protein